jgi:site-specific DNA-methyltransferase (adenine-specific)
VLFDEGAAAMLDTIAPNASRFFYSGKATRSEREEGLEGFPRKDPGTFAQDEWSREHMGGTPDAKRKPVANTHATIKPVDLMRWLVRLVTRPGGLVLDPFNGSGSTGVAAILEGARYVGIEREPEYCAISRARLTHASAQGDLFFGT